MILITGATGFVGRRLADILAAKGLPLRLVSRAAREGYIGVGDIDANTNWGAALEGVDTVIHLAARVHVMNETAENPDDLYFATNRDGTLHLAQQAAEAGAKRFIFISSIKVNGEETEAGKPYRPEDAPHPFDAYGRSKLEAEIGLMQISKAIGMEIVIIRPPLVYGPGVKANFRTMMRAVDKGLPLPLAGIGNARSLVFVDNLCDLIHTCLTHPKAAGETFLVSDGEDVSTPKLLEKIAKAMNKKARLLPFPLPLLRLAASLLGKGAMLQRLQGSLQVDISKTQSLLGWQPPFTLDEGLAKTAEHFKAKA